MNIRNRLKRSYNEFLNKYYKHIHSKGINYWLIVSFLIPIGMLIGDLLGEQKVWVSARYYLYQALQSSSYDSLTYSTRTAVVLIGDEEFWKGELARRTPLKRTYLAELLRKLDMANPAVIALDIDLRSQTPDRSVVQHSDYHAETATLLNTINSVSRNRPVVLPRTLISTSGTKVAGNPLAHVDRTYALEPSVFDGFSFETDNVRTGYVSLPYDIRQVPLVLRLNDGSTIDSFASAIVRTVDERAIQNAQAREEDGLPYGRFIPPENFEPLSAKYILETPPEILKSQLSARVVIIGGAWHENAFGRGKQVDGHATPVGEIGGVFIHSNYVEALLTHRTAKPSSKSFGVVVEVFLSIFIALVFAWNMKPWKKLTWAASLSLVLIFLTYVLWQNLGLFFDFFIPLILLGGHIVIERVLEWRREAGEYAKMLEQKEEAVCA